MKKKTPVGVWQKILPIINEHRSLYIPVDQENFAFKFIDSDPGSDFFFSCKLNESPGSFHVEFMPKEMNDNSKVSGTMDIITLLASLRTWFKVLKAYEDTQTPYDDVFHNAYEKEFYQSYKIDEPDADHIPFDEPRQLFLVEYLNKINRLTEAKIPGASEEAVKEIRLIQQDSESLKEDLSKLTKNQTIGRFAKVIAKVRKFSIQLYQELIMDFIKAKVVGGAEFVLKHYEEITKFLNDSNDSSLYL